MIQWIHGFFFLASVRFTLRPRSLKARKKPPRIGFLPLTSDLDLEWCQVSKKARQPVKHNRRHHETPLATRQRFIRAHKETLFVAAMRPWSPRLFTGYNPWPKR